MNKSQFQSIFQELVKEFVEKHLNVESVPFSNIEKKVVEHLEANQSLVVSGEPGMGKSYAIINSLKNKDFVSFNCGLHSYEIEEKVRDRIAKGNKIFILDEAQRLPASFDIQDLLDFDAKFLFLTSVYPEQADPFHGFWKQVCLQDLKVLSIEPAKISN